MFFLQKTLPFSPLPLLPLSCPLLSLSLSLAYPPFLLPSLSLAYSFNKA